MLQSVVPVRACNSCTHADFLQLEPCAPKASALCQTVHTYNLVESQSVLSPSGLPTLNQRTGSCKMELSTLDQAALLSQFAAPSELIHALSLPSCFTYVSCSSRSSIVANLTKQRHMCCFVMHFYAPVAPEGSVPIMIVESLEPLTRLL